jgi:hypothetical protein
LINNPEISKPKKIFNEIYINGDKIAIKDLIKQIGCEKEFFIKCLNCLGLKAKEELT